MDVKPTLEQAFEQIAKLRQDLGDANRQIMFMQRMGGFADSKALSVRATRIEDRLERLETDTTMLKDITGHVADWVARHLLDRHGVEERDNGTDSILSRKVRRRLAEWLDKTGLMGKRRDVAGARQDENRLRPVAQ